MWPLPLHLNGGTQLIDWKYVEAFVAAIRSPDLWLLLTAPRTPVYTYRPALRTHSLRCYCVVDS